MSAMDRNEADDGLEVFFAAARAEGPVPRAALRAAVEDDAAAVLAEHRRRAGPAPAAAVVHRSGGWLSDLWRTLGGWPALGTMAAAAAAGVWIGLMPLSALDALAPAAQEDALYASDLYPTLDEMMAEL